MAKRCVTFTFNAETIAEPVIYNIGQQFNLVTNIIRANLVEDRGWIEVELEGEEEDIENGIAWANSKGVRMNSVGEPGEENASPQQS